jgi:hypothetical protein
MFDDYRKTSLFAHSPHNFLPSKTSLKSLYLLHHLLLSRLSIRASFTVILVGGPSGCMSID